ncbi:MAG TPA: hypothetical protein DEO84_09625, partial [candidate division Zixibacteria bacterium]|nr:hypothetical protein [candidate division Zixibacteria bacterium]
EIVQNAILEIGDGKDFEIAYQGGNGIPAPDLSSETIKKSVVAFLTAALFESGSKGTLRLSSRSDNGNISLELKGESLSKAPKVGEKPAWLTEIEGRLECSRVEDNKGQEVDTWRLSFPLKRQTGAKPRPVEAPKVLAVDSQEVIRELLTGMLSSLGYDATVVSTSDDAFVIFKANLEAGKPFNYVIADYGLDKISGLELARELKSLDPDIFFLLISGWGLTPDPQNASRAGIDMMLKKPFRMEQLAEILRKSKREAAR